MEKKVNLAEDSRASHRISEEEKSRYLEENPTGKAASELRKRKKALLNERTIEVLVKENPKQVESKSWHRFELYRTGMKIKEFLEKGGKKADLDWDQKRGFIQIHGTGI